MHFSPIIISTLLSFSALGLAMPQAVDSKHVKRFSVPGASPEKGFNIPKDIPNGVYRVTIDSDGIAHHTKVEVPADGTLPSEDEATSSALDKRQSWQLTCAGYSMDRTATDTTVRQMKLSCGSGRSVRPGVHYYAYWDNQVTYFCNNTSRTYTCTEVIIREQIQESLSRRCGAYRAGWSTWGTGEGPVSTGCENMNSNKYFCGSNH